MRRVVRPGFRIVCRSGWWGTNIETATAAAATAIPFFLVGDIMDVVRFGGAGHQIFSYIEIIY